MFCQLIFQQKATTEKLKKVDNLLSKCIIHQHVTKYIAGLNNKAY